MSGVYPKPQAVGGRLIRQVISSLDSHGVSRPLDGPVRLAVSGGADSVALAVLLAKYGRRVVRRESLSILHLNHHWRGRESGQDQRWVRALAQRLGVRFHARDLNARAPAGESLEAWGRVQRLNVFRRYRSGWILLGHHRDDQAETVLWRMLSGAPRAQWSGIYPENGRILRPLLECRGEDLRAFLREEGIAWREDRSNQDPRFLRSQLRKNVVPSLDRMFPCWKDSLVRMAHEVRKSLGKSDRGAEPRR